jgi:transcriptional regulator with XRE-family HTH domain
MQFYRTHFGNKLKEAIKELPTTQVKLAEALDVEPPTVSRWVNGVDFPSDKYLEKLCTYLQVDMTYFGFDQSADELISYLFTNKDVLRALPKIPKDLIKMLGRQDEATFSHLRRVIETLEEKKKKNQTSKKAT